MTRFTLVVLPDGSSILTSPEALPWHEHDHIIRAFEEWRRRRQGVLTMAQTEVVRVESLDLDLPDPSDRVRGPEDGS